jgi:hypothetical protein
MYDGQPPTPVTPGQQFYNQNMLQEAFNLMSVEYLIYGQHHLRQAYSWKRCYLEQYMRWIYDGNLPAQELQVNGSTIKTCSERHPVRPA